MSHSASELLDVVAKGIKVYDLGRPMFVGMPQSPNHPQFRLALQRRHGDIVRSDGSSAANELIVTGGHVGTHIDALSHFSFAGLLHGGVRAEDAQQGGRFAVMGAETIAPMLCRGVLLDVPAALGRDACAAGYEITARDLESTLLLTGTNIQRGDVVLVRSGWGKWFDDAAAYVGFDSGVPGVGEEGARWLADHEASAVGADTIAFERLPSGAGHSSLPAHRVLLVDAGVYIIEALSLDELAEDETRTFLFVLSPLRLVGGTGSPVRPLAVVGAARPGADRQ